MDASLKMLQIIRVAMLAAIVLYVLIAHLALPHRPAPAMTVLYIVMFVAVMDVIALIILRRMFLPQPVAGMAAQTVDGKALAQWRVGYLLTYALSEAIALLGLVLNALGFTIRQALPFYIAGFALILFFRPRPLTNEIG